MTRKFWLFSLIAVLYCTSFFAQEDSLALRTERIAQLDSLPKNYKEYDPLSPARAAFYSAVLPGLGQAYNDRIWKIPIVYAGLGTSIYFYIDNNKQYHRYRDAYKRRLAGYADDEFDGVLSDDALIRAQQLYRRNKEISILVTLGIYLLNIIDANVDAHLQQFNVNNDLSLKPNLNIDEFSGNAQYGLSLNFNL